MRKAASTFTRDTPPTQKTQEHLFLSYARNDDEPFVAELYQELTSPAAGFKVWWDRCNMPSRGLTFLQEIRDAIDQCDRLVLVIGPKAVRSDYVRAEWQYALSAGKVVNPIVRLDADDVDGYELLPAELKNLDCPDARKARPRTAALQRILRVLREPIPPLGQLLGNLPEVPPHYQPRPDEMTRLADRVLLDTRHPRVLKPKERVTVIHGLPGVGKTALAAAFARSTETRRAFRDGVVWISVGVDAASQTVIESVVRVVGGIGAQRIQAEAATQLRRVLEDKACLVVLDNVWSLDVVEPFVNALGSRARLLVTTREASLVSALESWGQELAVLDEAASLRHLADWSGAPVGQLPPDAIEVARECGRLPFALALCGAMVSDGLRWTDLLAKLRAADLGFLEKSFPNYPHRDLLRAMNVSLDRLRRESKTALARYREIAVFPAGETVPVAAISTLWRHTGGLDEADTRKLLASLHGKSLLRLQTDGALPTITLHDLQWDFLAATVRDRVRLHRQIIAAYDQARPHGFASLPDDGYLFDHATYHLAEAKERDRLLRLIDKTWFEVQFAREAARQVFQKDVERVIDAAAQGGLKDLDQLARGCLLRASLSSLAADLPAGSVYVFARYGHAAKALDFARLVSGERTRANVLSHIARGLKDGGATAEAQKLAREVMELGQKVPGMEVATRSWAASILAELSDPAIGDIIKQAVTAARRCKDHYESCEYLARSAIAAWSAGQKSDAKRIAALAQKAALKVWIERVQALGRVAECRIKFGDFAEAEALIGALRKGELEQARLASQVAYCFAVAGERRLARKLASRAARLVSRAKRSFDRGDVLATCAETFATLGQPREAAEKARQAIAAERGHQPATKAWVFSGVALGLSSSGHRQLSLTFARRALKAANAVGKHVPEKPGILASVAETFATCGDRHSAEATAERALAKAATLEWNERALGTAQAAIAEALARMGRDELATNIAAGIRDDYARDQALRHLSLSFAVTGRPVRCLGAARMIRTTPLPMHGEYWQSDAVRAAIQALPAAKLHTAATALLKGVTDSAMRAQTFCWLAPFQDREWIEEAMSSLSTLAPNAAKAEATEHVVRALLRQKDRRRAENVAKLAWGHLDILAHSERVQSLSSIARVVTLLGQRTRWRALARMAVVPGDAEYSACGLSRVALTFAEAKWFDEAAATAHKAAALAKKIGEGRPHGTGDAYARLARVMLLLGDRDQAGAHAESGLRGLAGESGSCSSYEYPGIVRQDIGRTLAEALGWEGGIALIKKALSKHGGGFDPVLGMCQHFASVRDFSALQKIEAIATTMLGRNAWLVAHLAALRHANGDSRHGRASVVEALKLSSRESYADVLSTLSICADVIAAIDGGAILERIQAALVEIEESWFPRPAAGERKR